MTSKRYLITKVIQFGAFLLVCCVILRTTEPWPATHVDSTGREIDYLESIGNNDRRCHDCSTPQEDRGEHALLDDSVRQQELNPSQQSSIVNPRVVGGSPKPYRVMRNVIMEPHSVQDVQSHWTGTTDEVERALQHPGANENRYQQRSRGTNGSTSNPTTTQATSSLLAIVPKSACRGPLCSEYLTKEDKNRFASCLHKVKSNGGHPQDGQCQFMPQTHRAPVALASYPGSGNTWLRGLLEAATGICTGFEFCDISMRVKGFAGENIVSGAVLAVKTHGYPHWKTKGKHNNNNNNGVHFDSAVVIVRNPLNAFVAEWNRRVANNFRGSTVSLSSHVKSARKEMFGQPCLYCICYYYITHHKFYCLLYLHDYTGTNKKWVEFLHEQLPRWQEMVKNWVTLHGRHPILVVKYEDLKRDALFQVKRILTFLKMPFAEEVVERRLTEGFNSFHRNHKAKFDHYTPFQRQHVLRAINSTIHLLNVSGHAQLLDLHEYLEV